MGGLLLLVLRVFSRSFDDVLRGDKEAGGGGGEWPTNSPGGGRGRNMFPTFPGTNFGITGGDGVNIRGETTPEAAVDACRNCIC